MGAIHDNFNARGYSRARRAAIAGELSRLRGLILSPGFTGYSAQKKNSMANEAQREYEEAVLSFPPGPETSYVFTSASARSERAIGASALEVIIDILANDTNPYAFTGDTLTREERQVMLGEVDRMIGALS